MVKESIIDQVVELFENQEDCFEKTAQDFIQQQPALLALLMSETEGVLSEDELDFMLYLALVVYKSIETESGKELEQVDEETISFAEEANWAVIAGSKGRTFREKLDTFFEDTDQEDLLAFVEDSLTIGGEDEEGALVHLTPEGQEPMFVTLKTLIDVLTSEGTR